MSRDPWADRVKITNVPPPGDIICIRDVQWDPVHQTGYKSETVVVVVESDNFKFTALQLSTCGTRKPAARGMPMTLIMDLPVRRIKLRAHIRVCCVITPVHLCSSVRAVAAVAYSGVPQSVAAGTGGLRYQSPPDRARISFAEHLRQALYVTPVVPQRRTFGFVLRAADGCVQSDD